MAVSARIQSSRSPRKWRLSGILLNKKRLDQEKLLRPTPAMEFRLLLLDLRVQPKVTTVTSIPVVPGSRMCSGGVSWRTVPNSGLSA